MDFFFVLFTADNLDEMCSCQCPQSAPNISKRSSISFVDNSVFSLKEKVQWDNVLIPHCDLKRLRVWEQYFFRWDDSVHNVSYFWILIKAIVSFGIPPFFLVLLLECNQWSSWRIKPFVITERSGCYYFFNYIPKICKYWRYWRRKIWKW